MENKQPIRLESISEFHSSRGLPLPEHPLISVIDFGKVSRSVNIGENSWVFGFYQISLKKGIDFNMKYGQQKYDFESGVMGFIAPNQVFKIDHEANPAQKRSGWMLLVHPDFLWNTTLAKTIKEYEYFGYSINEALFLSAKEEKTVNGIIENIRQEYQANIDKFSKQIIISQIETLLGYSERFYNRQFITREKSNHQILKNLEGLLNNHFQNDSLILKGLPTVHDIAGQLNISQKYLSTLLKVLTGQSTQQHIHNKLIEKAKEKLSTTNLSISEIAYDLGFEHSQSFSKLFKSKTSQSPLKFRSGFN
ncbi:AraC-type DNA-binding protein [Flavobacterium aquidurense]|uniref:AraC family transcriptional regulator n=1 Tax=Flavobacterium frigidimaris TaxID=262320 RepID=A0ABX4BLZ4_FLAFR|nr:helix-turn-helix transcriptional regulator [Flavobacterium frigidimaris]OXA76550.1 AraC family transcriptional regulator [Flavobacterium frigidimaris]SDZ66952.1 AraC-type DNA-binding protein [Flavobacterium aquidurense]